MLDYLQGAPVRYHLKGVVSALDLRAIENLVEVDMVPEVAGFREANIPMVLDFDQ